MGERVKADAVASTDHAALRWRSRRGMLELELLLAPFVDARLEVLCAQQLRAYAALLECEDWDLFHWLQGKAAPPVAHESIVEDIRAFHRNR